MAATALTPVIQWNKYPAYTKYFAQRRKVTEDVLRERIKYYKRQRVLLDVYVLVFLEQQQRRQERTHENYTCTHFNHRKGEGCSRDECKFTHICAMCNSTHHGVYFRNDDGSFVCRTHAGIDRDYNALRRLHPELDELDFYNAWLVSKNYASIIPSTPEPTPVHVPAVTTAPTLTSSSVAERVFVQESPAPTQTTLESTVKVDGALIHIDEQGKFSISGFETGASFDIRAGGAQRKIAEFSTVPDGLKVVPTKYLIIHVCYQ